MTESDADEFCARVLPRLVASLSLYAGDRSLGEELAQEALARAWERWDRVGRMASPEAWVFQTARNLARRRFRRRAMERRASRRARATDLDPDPATTVAVRQAVRALPERQRATIVARYFLDLSVAETAEMLGCADGTVKAATNQALTSLRQSGLISDDASVRGEAR